MTIRTKLTISTLFSVFTVGGVGGLFYWTQQIEERYRSEMTGEAHELATLKEIVSDVERQIARVDFFLITQDLREIDVFHALAKTNARRLAAKEFDWTQAFEETQNAAVRLFNAVRQRRALGKTRVKDFNSLAGRLRLATTAFLANEESRVEARRRRTEGRLLGLERLSLGLVVFGVVFVGWVNIYIYFSVLTPLGILKGAVEAMGQGKQETRVAIKSRDEFAIVANAFNKMVERLKELDEMKKDLTASVTHELRSPLSAGQSFLNALLGDLDRALGGRAVKAVDLEKWKEFLLRLRSNLERLNLYVSDLLDMAKIERGGLKCHLEPIVIGPVLEELLRFFEEKAKQKEITLETILPQESLPTCLGDKGRLHQVVLNLLDNAIKFSPRGGIVRVAASLNGSPRARFVQITVQDSGPGIPKEHQDRLFGKFEQIKESYRYAEGAKGTGLGLAISKAIIEQHGGKIWAASNGEKPGSAFAFTIPIAKERM